MAKNSKKRLAERLHDALNNLVAKQLVAVDFVRFDRDGDIIISQGTREALNRSDTVKTYVKATHWFDVFWYYVNIQVRKDTDGVSELPFVSVSFFQDEDDALVQLFRAEWDNFKQKSHPQPHWHITNYKEMGFESINDEPAVDDDNPFAALETKVKKVELPKIHFAMAGDWHDSDKECMVSDYTNENQLANWLNNLFDHVREELTYAY